MSGVQQVRKGQPVTRFGHRSDGQSLRTVHTGRQAQARHDGRGGQAWLGGGEPVGTAATIPEGGLSGLLLSVAPGILGFMVADLRGRGVEPAVVAGCSPARPGASACAAAAPR
jgi:hypothetical protein